MSVNWTRVNKAYLGDYFTAHMLSEEYLFLHASASTYIVGINKKKGIDSKVVLEKPWENESSHTLKNVAADFPWFPSIHTQFQAFMC